MPIFEYECRACGNTIERYHPSLKASPGFMVCGDGAKERGEVRGCGGPMQKIMSVPHVETFKPFTTRNIDPSGAVTHVTSRSQLEMLKRKFGVREARVNGMFGGDMRSNPINPERPTGPVKPRARKEAVRITPDEAKALQARAEHTNFGARRA